MALRKLDKAEWLTFCETMSKALIGDRTEIEVASLKLGDQIAAERLPLLGIAYRPENDVIEITLQGRNHLVRNPRELYVDFDVGGLMSMEIIDRDDARHIIKLHEPLLLPPPAAHQTAPAGGE